MKHKIMVVDDAAELRDVLRLYLENAGYEVVEAVNGFDALKCLESHNIDLMILDIMMPNMDGFELKTFRPAGERPGFSHNLPVSQNSGS